LEEILVRVAVLKPVTGTTVVIFPTEVSVEKNVVGITVVRSFVITSVMLETLV
jgi:hypothetical protein